MNHSGSLKHRQFVKGEYDVFAVREGTARPLLEMRFDADDTPDARRLPQLAVHPQALEDDIRRTLCAAVRAGAEHPGLRDDELARLHRVAACEGYVELFADLNALTTGLLLCVVRSLGKRLGRIVVSSSSIDILHEYQSHVRKGDSAGHLQKNEMARALHLIEEVREIAPVHVHQLPPGASRYFTRSGAGPSKIGKGEAPDLQEDEASTFIAEDRQMVAAYWHYIANDNPRLPVLLVTSDFPLAHACKAERVPFFFASSPYERYRSQPAPPRTLWFDPFALELRYCTAQRLLWELGLVFRKVRVVGHGPDGPNFEVHYEPKRHGPRDEQDVEILEGDALAPLEEGVARRRGGKGNMPRGAERNMPRGGGGNMPRRAEGNTKPAADATKPTETTPRPPRAAEDRRVKLSLQAVLSVLPTRRDQRIDLATFSSVKNEDAVRQLTYVGERSGLFSVADGHVSGGPNLVRLLKALGTADYVEVNRLFRSVPSYDAVLKTAEASGLFPPSSAAGAMPGWAVVLGAAFKTKNDGLRYGLGTVDDAAFESAVARFHAELAKKSNAAPLPAVLERVCTALRLSPARFEAMLTGSIGRGALAAFELQRATVDAPLPEHPLLTAPSSADPGSYLRTIKPGRGISLEGRLMGSLVRRPEGDER